MRPDACAPGEGGCVWGVRTGRDLLTYQTAMDRSAGRCPEVSGVAEMPSGGSTCRAWWWPGDGGPPTMEAT